MKTITLTLNVQEAIEVRDALIDAAVALRTEPCGTVLSKEEFLLAANVTTARKKRYFSLMEKASKLGVFILVSLVKGR